MHPNNKTGHIPTSPTHAVQYTDSSKGMIRKLSVCDVNELKLFLSWIGRNPVLYYIKNDIWKCKYKTNLWGER